MAILLGQCWPLEIAESTKPTEDILASSIFFVSIRGRYVTLKLESASRNGDGEDARESRLRFHAGGVLTTHTGDRNFLTIFGEFFSVGVNVWNNQM